MLKIIISAFIGFGITFMIEYAHECNIKPITREKKACKTLTKTTFFF
jgi:hypothetical protein